MRTYQVITTNGTSNYKGFDMDFSPVELDHVVLYTHDGELEIVAVDKPPVHSDLVAYLATQPGRVEIIGVYTRKGA